MNTIDNTNENLNNTEQEEQHVLDTPVSNESQESGYHATSNDSQHSNAIESEHSNAIESEHSNAIESEHVISEDDDKQSTDGIASTDEVLASDDSDNNTHRVSSYLNKDYSKRNSTYQRNTSYQKNNERTSDFIKDRDLRKTRFKKFDKIATKKLEIDYKKPEILQEFLTEKGKILSRVITGCSAQNQRKLTLEVKRARYVGLLPTS